MLPAGLRTSRVCVFGATGFGKTTLARHLIFANTRVLVVDPGREYVGSGVEVGSTEELAAYLEKTRGKFRAVFYSDALDEEFETLALAAYDMGDVTICVEEVQEFASPVLIGARFAKLLKYGRHHGVHHLAVSQRPAETHRLVTSQCWGVYSFALHEPRDLDYMRRAVGSDFAEGLEDLPPYHFRYQDRRDRPRVFEGVVTPQDVSVRGERAHRPEAPPGEGLTDTPEERDTGPEGQDEAAGGK